MSRTYEDIVNTVDSQLIKNEEGRLIPNIPQIRHHTLFWTNFFLNWDCTRKCPDCFASLDRREHFSKEKNKPDLFNPIRMTDEVFNKLLPRLVEIYYQHNFERSSYVFLGGEPLLEFDRIVKIQENNTKHNLKGILTQIQTNCDLVDRVDFSLLNFPAIIAFNVGTTPMEEIERRVRVLKSFDNLYRIELHMTAFEENLERIPKIADYALKNHMKPIVYRDQFMLNDEEYKGKYLEVLHKLIDAWENNLHMDYRGLNPKYTLFDNLIANPTTYDEVLHLCGRRQLTVYPDGNIGTCVRAIEHRVGNIFEDNIVESIKGEKFLNTVHSKYTHEDCRTCDVRFTCHGGCPHDKMVTYGDNTADKKHPLCEVYKQIIPRLLGFRKKLNTKLKGEK